MTRQTFDGHEAPRLHGNPASLRVSTYGDSEAVRLDLVGRNHTMESGTRVAFISPDVAAELRDFLIAEFPPPVEVTLPAKFEVGDIVEIVKTDLEKWRGYKARVKNADGPWLQPVYDRPDGAGLCQFFWPKEDLVLSSFPEHEFAVGDRVVVHYGHGWDGEGTVDGHAGPYALVKVDGGDYAGLVGGFTEENLGHPQDVAPDPIHPVGTLLIVTGDTAKWRHGVEAGTPVTVRRRTDWAGKTGYTVTEKRYGIDWVVAADDLATKVTIA